MLNKWRAEHASIRCVLKYPQIAINAKILSAYDLLVATPA
jgi:hypothetical protein